MASPSFNPFEITLVIHQKTPTFSIVDQSLITTYKTTAIPDPMHEHINYPHIPAKTQTTIFSKLHHILYTLQPIIPSRRKRQLNEGLNLIPQLFPPNRRSHELHTNAN